MLRARFWPLAAFLIFAPASVHAQCIKKSKPTPAPAPAPAMKASEPVDREAYYESFPYSKKLLGQKDIAGLTDVYGELEGGMATFARMTIFGKHGRIFRESDIQDTLKGEKWYKPNPNFSNSMLNDMERSNLDIVRGSEAEQHSFVEPGDLRYWRDKTITVEKLLDENDAKNNPSLISLHIMRTEIEAIHGKRFEDEPLIQKYFNERYWYRPAAQYDPKSLNDHERANLALLAKLEAKAGGNSLVPGSMLAYGEKPIQPHMIKGLNLYHLRLLRNEIYAIRGGLFHTGWIQTYFDGQDWYSPLPKGSQPQLTPLDERNVALILKRENLLHQELSTRKLNEMDLRGMLSDDAGRLKDEIYARRGKVFKSKWLQSYFASMAWYKPDPTYTDKLLSPIERQNVQILAKYEKKATAQEDMTEG